MYTEEMDGIKKKREKGRHGKKNQVLLILYEPTTH